MAQLATVGCKVSGHDLCPETSIVTGDEFFKVSGKAVAVVGSLCASHSCKDHGSHQDAISAGAPHFTVNGKPVARVGDAVDHGNSVASGVGFIDVGNNGGTQCGLAISYEAVNACLKHYIIRQNGAVQDIDLTILATPKIAINEASLDQDKDRRWGWEVLAPMLEKWISGDAYDGLGKDIDESPESVSLYMLDIDWDKLLKIERIKEVYYALAGFTDAENKQKALAVLPEVIRQCSPGTWEKGGGFDYSNVDPHLYKRHSFNYMPVKNRLNFDAVTVFLADFSLKALPAGRIEVNGDGTRTIFVDKLYIYVDDRFNFEDEEFLGGWDRDKLRFASLLTTRGYTTLYNSSFRDFRRRNGKGGDFWVLSRPREVPEFVPFSYTRR